MTSLQWALKTFWNNFYIARYTNCFKEIFPKHFFRNFWEQNYISTMQPYTPSKMWMVSKIRMESQICTTSPATNATSWLFSDLRHIYIYIRVIMCQKAMADILLAVTWQAIFDTDNWCSALLTSFQPATLFQLSTTIVLHAGYSNLHSLCLVHLSDGDGHAWPEDSQASWNLDLQREREREREREITFEYVPSINCLAPFSAQVYHFTESTSAF